MLQILKLVDANCNIFGNSTYSMMPQKVHAFVVTNGKMSPVGKIGL